MKALEDILNNAYCVIDIMSYVSYHILGLLQKKNGTHHSKVLNLSKTYLRMKACLNLYFKHDKSYYRDSQLQTMQFLSAPNMSFYFLWQINTGILNQLQKNFCGTFQFFPKKVEDLKRATPKENDSIFLFG